jgi:iron-sulfur cluster repair protein YtfE (RIC family)
MSVVELLGEDHRQCDRAFAQAETAADKGDMARCAEYFAAFRSTLLRHFRMEEDILFPDFEAATGGGGGPTTMMRQEHAMMRELLDELQHAVEAHSETDFLGAAETLMVLMQQHNMKEEGILYPMCDQALAGHWESLRARMLELPAE